MTAFLTVRDPASMTKAVGLSTQSGVAAGAGDNTELTSPAIDRMGTGLGGFMAAIVAIAYTTTVAAAQTLKATVKVSGSDDGSTGWTTDVVLANLVTLETGVVTAKCSAYELGVDLSAYKRFVRFKITLDLSAGATDVFVYGASLLLSGADKLPQ